MTELNVEKQMQDFLNIARTNITRDGINGILEYMCGSDFFTAPASTRYHLACPGGLCKHSLNVYNRLLKEVAQEYGSVEESPYSLESLTLVSLFHDICKIDFYTEGTRNVKQDGKWVQVPYYTIEEKLPIAHGYKSQYILRSYVNLSREESIAIMSHMGGFDVTVKGGDQTISAAMEKYPLALLLHIADLKASTLDEKDI